MCTMLVGRTTKPSVISGSAMYEQRCFTRNRAIWATYLICPITAAEPIRLKLGLSTLACPVQYYGKIEISKKWYQVIDSMVFYDY